MRLDVILGNNIDTKNWITFIRKTNNNIIIVLDYDYYGVPYKKDSIYYMSVDSAELAFKKNSKINYYKSCYAFPGMSGQMSSLYSSQRKLDE